MCALFFFLISRSFSGKQTALPFLICLSHADLGCGLQCWGSVAYTTHVAVKYHYLEHYTYWKKSALTLSFIIDISAWVPRSMVVVNIFPFDSNTVPVRQNTHNFIWIDAEHLIGIGIQLRFKWQLKNREYLVSWMPYSLACAELLLLEFLCIFCIRGWMFWVWGFSLPVTFTLLPSCVLLGFVTVWKLLAIPVSLSSGNL